MKSWKIAVLLISVLFVLACSTDGTESVSDGDQLLDGDIEAVEDDQDLDIGDGDMNEDGDLDTVEADSDSSDTPETDLEPDAPEDDEYETELPPWPTCERIQSDEPLVEKAAYFDRVARERHIAGDGLLRNLRLNEDLDSVELWYHVENTILWSGMYLASQSFRYAVTGEQEAVENARRVVDALHQLTLVTGSSGLYGRSMLNPEVSYNPIPPEHSGWSDSPAPGFEGWRFRNDVSKDGYAGLMFGYAAAMEHLDDPQLLADVRARLREIIDHLVGNGLQIIDISGEVTEHGRLFHSAFDDFPGFNAMLASSWIKIAQTALDDPTLDDFYYGCLMEMREGVDCPDIEVMDMGTYIESMETYLYLFLPNCKQNYDNFDMCYQAIYPLLRREQDPVLRERLLGVVRNNMFHTDDPDAQSVDVVGNAFYTFSYAAVAQQGSDNPMLANAVDLAICMLKDFPSEKFERAIPIGQQESVCINRLDDPTAAETIPLSEYHFDNYLWRLDFFEIQTQEWQENRRMIYSPEDYLVVYWMGRLHGILPADL
jgi:hypothetical protein